MINWEQELIQLAGTARAEESMRMHTTFQVGGPADYFIEVDSAEKISSVRKLCREQGVPCYVIGKGSNLLVGDNGIRGVVLHIGDGMSDCRQIEQCQIRNERYLRSRISNNHSDITKLNAFYQLCIRSQL